MSNNAFEQKFFEMMQQILLQKIAVHGGINFQPWCYVGAEGVSASIIGRPHQRGTIETVEHSMREFIGLKEFTIASLAMAVEGFICPMTDHVAIDFARGRIPGDEMTREWIPGVVVQSENAIGNVAINAYRVELNERGTHVNIESINALPVGRFPRGFFPATRDIAMPDETNMSDDVPFSLFAFHTLPFEPFTPSTDTPGEAPCD
jgi:hypothetical protein